MSKVSNIFSSPDVYRNATQKNYEGFDAFNLTLEEEFVQMLYTNLIENTFYVDASVLLDRSLELHRKMLDKDVVFFTNAIVDARTNGHMRLQPIIGLVFLSTHHSKWYFHRAFRQVIRTPNDLKDFIQIARSGKIRQGLGRTVKTAINDWLLGISEYHVLKYPSSRGWALRDILRMTRPTPRDKYTKQLFRYIVNGVHDFGIPDFDSIDSLRQIQGYEYLKKGIAHMGDSEIVKLIEEYRLPYEAIIGHAPPSQKVWTALMHQMPFQALLMNLNTLDRHGVFDNPKNVDYVVSVLSDRERVLNSKQLPYQFWSAYNDFSAYNGGNQRISDAIIDGLEASFENIPDVPGNIVIATDVSGSMDSRISNKSAVRYIDIAGLFTGALLKKAQYRVAVLPFNDCVTFSPYTYRYRYSRKEKEPSTKVRFSRRDSIMTTAKKVQHLLGGGTSLAAPIDYMLKHNIKADFFIGITDSEEWHPGPISRGFWEGWKRYKRANPKAKAILLNIAPYGHRPTPAEAINSDVYFISGWSTSVVNVIASIANGSEDQIEKIKSMPW